MWQISYPPANGASQGNYFLPKSHKLAVFEEKTALAAKHANFFPKGFWFWLEERSNNLALTPYTWVCGFFLLLPPNLLRS